MKWIFGGVSMCGAIWGQYLDIKETLALGLSGDIWTIIALGVLFAVISSLIWNMQKEQEKLKEQVQGITIHPTTTTTTPPAETRRAHIRDEELYISDLARHEDKITAKVFENCLIIGPAVVTFIGCDARDSGFEGDAESLFIEVPERRVLGAIAFENCIFRSCRFRRIGIIGTPDLIQYMREALTPRT
jgi:hypothetical protein